MSSPPQMGHVSSTDLTLPMARRRRPAPAVTFGMLAIPAGVACRRRVEGHPPQGSFPDILRP